MCRIVSSQVIVKFIFEYELFGQLSLFGQRESEDKLGIILDTRSDREYQSMIARVGDDKSMFGDDR